MNSTLETVMALARTRADYLASLGKHREALAMYEHSNVNGESLAERGMRLHRIYYDLEGPALVKKIKCRMDELVVTHGPLCTGIYNDPGTRELIDAYEKLVLERTGFNYRGFPHIDCRVSEPPDDLVDAIVKAAFRISGGKLNCD